MSGFFTAVAAVLVVTIAGGLVRVAKGPSQADRMVAAQLFGTTGVAILLLLAESSGEDAVLDVALTFALLAAVLSVAFVKRGWIRSPVPGETSDAGENDSGNRGDAGPGTAGGSPDA